MDLVIGLSGELTDTAGILLRILGMALLSATVTGAVAIGYRWYARMPMPANLAVMLGLSAVALWLNSIRTLSQYIDPIVEPFTLSMAAVNIGAFLVGGIMGVVGARAGDRVATNSSAVLGSRSFDGELSPFVRAVGRVIDVTLPEDIEDIDGYDPADPALKDDLAGRTLLFPRGLTVTELRKRLIERLKDDFDVGHVDVDLAEDGTVEYLAIGSRAAGLGPTLPPGTVATAVRGDPPNQASPGDTVQLWRVGETIERVATGELRGAVDDVVTVAVDETEAAALAADTRFRLITLSADSRPDREFATLLRTADETMGVLEVETGSGLVDQPIQDLEATVVAVRTPEGIIEGVPSRTRRLTAGDTIYAIATPETLRRLEANARPAT